MKKLNLLDINRLENVQLGKIFGGTPPITDGSGDDEPDHPKGPFGNKK